MLSWPVEPNKLFVKDLGVDAVGLATEVADVLTRTTFEEGYRGLSLALPRADQVLPNGRGSEINLPFRGLMDDYPILRGIFDVFTPGVRAYRLLKRPAMSSYHVHQDAPYRPGNLYRMQIPVVQGPGSTLCTTEYWGKPYVYDDPDPPFPNSTRLTRAIFEGAFKEHGRCWTMTPGILHHFRNDFYHTLINESPTEDRITLIIDLEHDPWVMDFIRSFEEVQPA